MNDKPTLKEIILNILAKADGLMTKDIVDAVSYELGRQVRMDTIVVTLTRMSEHGYIERVSGGTGTFARNYLRDRDESFGIHPAVHRFDQRLREARARL